jgi:hypothetical protein
MHNDHNVALARYVWNVSHCPRMQNMLTWHVISVHVCVDLVKISEGQLFKLWGQNCYNES